MDRDRVIKRRRCMCSRAQLQSSAWTYMSTGDREAHQTVGVMPVTMLAQDGVVAPRPSQAFGLASPSPRRCAVAFWNPAQCDSSLAEFIQGPGPNIVSDQEFRKAFVRLMPCANSNHHVAAGVPKPLAASYVRDIRATSLQFRHSAWQATPITPTVGLRQGGSLRPMVFRWVLEDVLATHAREIGVERHGHCDGPMSSALSSMRRRYAAHRAQSGILKNVDLRIKNCREEGGTRTETRQVQVVRSAAATQAADAGGFRYPGLCYHGASRCDGDQEYWEPRRTRKQITSLSSHGCWPELGPPSACMQHEKSCTCRSTRPSRVPAEHGNGQANCNA